MRSLMKIELKRRTVFDDIRKIVLKIVFAERFANETGIRFNQQRQSRPIFEM